MDGVVSVKANQKIIVPSLIKNAVKLKLDEQGGRELITLGDVDVTRDVVDLSIIIESEATSEYLNFTSTLISWEEEELVI